MGMCTIVQYIARKSPYNGYPERILSPPFPASCCVAQMERVGEIEWENGFPYYYRRCRVCGYAVRHFLPMKPVEGEFLRFLEAFRRPSEAPNLSRLGARPHGGLDF